MKIAMLGDIAPFGRYCKARNPRVERQFDTVREYLASHDVVIGNLETPFADNEKAAGWKSAHVKSHPENIELLKALGVTHVTLANNHIGDFGVKAYERTTSLLEEAGIEWFGIERRKVKIDFDGEKIALLGYCSYTTNPSKVWLDSGQALNLLEIDSVLEAMEEVSASGYLPILAVHSGQEHVHTPSSHDVTFARGLAERFDYIYYGHHPHVVQGAEVVCNSPIFYSVGNFIFDDVYTPRDPEKPLIALSEANKTGVIASVEVIGGKVDNWGVTPVYMGINHMLFGEEVEGFDMKRYSNSLIDAGSSKYNNERLKTIGELIEGRRAMRDLKWYLRRLNINSAGMILSARANAKKYQAEFVNKLSKLGDQK